MRNKPTATIRWAALLQCYGSFGAIEQKLFQQGTSLPVLAARMGVRDASNYRRVCASLVAGINKHSPVRAKWLMAKVFYELIGKEPA